MVLCTWKERDCELLSKEKVLQSFNHNDLLHLTYRLLTWNRATHTVGYYLFWVPASKHSLKSGRWVVKGLYTEKSLRDFQKNSQRAERVRYMECDLCRADDVSISLSRTHSHRLYGGSKGISGKSHLAEVASAEIAGLNFLLYQGSLSGSRRLLPLSLLVVFLLLLPFLTCNLRNELNQSVEAISHQCHGLQDAQWKDCCDGEVGWCGRTPSSPAICILYWCSIHGPIWKNSFSFL